MNLQLLRNATQILTVNNKTILIDPMFAPKGSYPPFLNTGNEVENPTVDLPVSNKELQQIINKVDAVLLTHLHTDHLDIMAQQLLPKSITTFCQPVNAEAVRKLGFTNVVRLKMNWYGMIWISIVQVAGTVQEKLVKEWALFQAMY